MLQDELAQLLGEIRAARLAGDDYMPPRAPSESAMNPTCVDFPAPSTPPG